MSRLSKIAFSIFLHQFLKTSKMVILMQTYVWLQSYEGFDNAKNNMKQKQLNTVFANISKTTSPTSDSFLLIMSHLLSFLNKEKRVIKHVTLFIQLSRWRCSDTSQQDYNRCKSGPITLKREIGTLFLYTCTGLITFTFMFIKLTLV